ncbi:MAG TPA: hypothetical protein VLF93_04790 [Candidatus Saccharimonadales bacterium]|nr:hypothetical protein [Candidatus Saccharimonadales bacterium]
MANSNKDVTTNPAKRAILRTILYSDIFSFPLTRDELWKFLMSEKEISHNEFLRNLNLLPQIISKDGYYCLKNRTQIISQRKKNLSEVTKKMERARDISAKLSVIPSVLFIGISGGLAVGDAREHDDIDFVVITKKNTLFTTRLLLLLLLQLLGVRRARTQKKAKDKICLNLLFDETSLSWFEIGHDSYLAREIAQILPLFEREDTYHKFLLANKWILKFLPNALQSSQELYISQKARETVIEDIIFTRFVESLLRSLQTKWMKRHQTREVVKKNLLAFHPNDYRAITLRRLRLKLRQFGLLTKF